MAGWAKVAAGALGATAARAAWVRRNAVALATPAVAEAAWVTRNAPAVGA